MRILLFLHNVSKARHFDGVMSAFSNAALWDEKEAMNADQSLRAAFMLRAGHAGKRKVRH